MLRTSFNWLSWAFLLFVVAGCANENLNNEPLLEQLQGRWVTCLGGSPTMAEEVVFQDNRWTSYWNEYADSNCVTLVSPQQSAQGTIRIGDAVITTSGITARKLDITDDIDTYYSIYFIDQNRMYLGDTQTGDGTSDANRPTEIDFTFYYEKRAGLNNNVGDGSTSPTPGDSSSGGIDAQPPTTEPPSFDLTTLEGTWMLCDGTGLGAEITFSNGSYSVYSTAYQEPDCLTRTSSSLSGEGTYIIGNSITTTSGLVATELDGVNELGENFYDLVYIDQGLLYFGDYATADGSIPENRPTDIDLTVSLVKIS